MLLATIAAAGVLGAILFNTDALSNVFFDSLQVVWNAISQLKEKFTG